MVADPINVSTVMEQNAQNQQNQIDRFRKNAAFNALQSVYGPAAGDPETWGKLESINEAQQLQPGKVQAQSIQNQTDQQALDVKRQDQQRNNAYSLVQMLRSQATQPDGSINPDAYDKLLSNPAVQQIVGVSPEQAAQLKPLLTAPGGAAHLDSFAEAILGPQQVTGAAIPVQNADGTYGVIKTDKFGRSVQVPLNGAQPVSAVQGQERIDVSKERAAIAKLATDNGVTLSPEALDMAAQIYKQTGQVPNLGWGAKGAAARGAVINKAAEGGTSGDQIVSNEQGNKAKQTYLNDLAKSSPTSAGGLARSAGAVLAHIDTIDQMVDALGNKNVRLANYLSQKYKQETGKALPTTFDAQKTIVGDELTRYLIARGGTLHDREQLQSALSKANSPAQLKGVIKIYKDDIGAQLYSQYSQAKGLGADKQFLGIMTPYAREILTGVEEPSNHPTPGQLGVTQPKLPSGWTYLGTAK